jgi:GNAT superfamily N-acetyltransferase
VIEVRAAQADDGVFLLQATLELAKHHGWENSVTATAHDLENSILKPNAIIGAFLAFEDGEFAGSLVWHRSFSTNRGCEVIYLEDIIVMERSRRKGVAESLMKVLAQFAVTNGYPSIYWVMMNWNSGARDFYTKIGADVEADSSVYSLRGDALLRMAE